MPLPEGSTLSRWRHGFESRWGCALNLSGHREQLNLCRLSPEAFALGLVVTIGGDSRLTDELTVFVGEGHDVIEDVKTD